MKMNLIKQSNETETRPLELRGQAEQRIVYVTCSEELTRLSDLLPANEGRQSLVSSLHEAYNLCQNTLTVPRVGRSTLEKYHDRSYLDILLKRRDQLDKSFHGYEDMKSMLQDEENGISDDSETSNEENFPVLEENNNVKLDDIHAGLTHDCYPFPFMSNYSKLVASSSITAATLLARSSPALAVNWFGGRHHCTKSKAAGFCYINDIVLSIGVLRRKFGRVFYLDLDLHHGDGVEAAYWNSKNVATCLIHRFELGFYPGTGSLESSEENRYNIPTKSGLSDESLQYILQETVIPLIAKFNPGAIVIQCGCDGLATDPSKQWNLTIKGFTSAVKAVVDSFPRKSILLLGGGGYNHTETAKCWANITKTLSGNEGDWDILPEHPFLDSYEKDGYQFWTDENKVPKRMKDGNSKEYLDNIRTFLLQKMPFK